MIIARIYRAPVFSVSITVLLFLLAGFFLSNTPINNDPKNNIREEKFISINGIEHWVTIKGASSKPVILFIHGGPGSPISPYSDTLYKDWEKDFIIVQWDQRGAGRTFGKNAPEELTPEFLHAHPLTIDQMTADGIELSEYLAKHLEKQKIILFGTSWGSALAVKMATKRPELFYAYIGHSQVVKPAIDTGFYHKIYKLAERNNDTDALKKLNNLGKPPYDRAQKTGQLLRIVKKYEAENSTPAPASWFAVSPAYDNEKDNKDRSDGDDYSFVNYTGDSRLNVASMSATIDLLKDNTEFKIPVYLIQGKEDILTPKESTRKYFDKIKAPGKKYYLLPETAHGFNTFVLETQYKICKRIKAL